MDIEREATSDGLLGTQDGVVHCLLSGAGEGMRSLTS